MDRTDNRAWLAVLPVLLVVAFSAVVPLMTVVNYSVQDILDINTRLFVGADWYRQTISDPDLQAAFFRQIAFSLSVLIIEVPLGILVALNIPRNSRWISLLLIVIAIPLLIPWNVVGTIWQIFARGDIGLMGVFLGQIGVEFNYAVSPRAAWITLLMMDVWHWTSLVVLLAFAGVSSIPAACYLAAELDGASRWQVFLHVELPRLRAVLTIAVLLRLMDSLMIYTEPFVLTGGGPGSSTTFLSQHLATMAVGQFDLGPAAAFSVVYFLVVLLCCWLFYSSVVKRDAT